MTREEIRQAIENFMDVILGDHPVDEREAKLYFALDQLAIAFHFADYTFDETNFPEAVKRDYSSLRSLIGPNFPNLGLYNVVLEVNEKLGEDVLATGDAIDDICDIAGHMEEVLWCWKNTSIDDALWHFKEPYSWHWGKHLRDLQSCLFEKLYS